MSGSASSESAIQLVGDLVEALIEAEASVAGRSELDYPSARREVLRLIPAVQALAGALPYGVGPDDLEPTDEGWEFATTHDAAVRLQGAIENVARVREAISEHAPQLSAERFHPWVWEAAASLWRDGHHRNAIQAAAAQIETRLQAKLGREDVSGVALIREAFSLTDPVAGKPRLRFHWLKEESEAYRSRHEGAMSFGAGVLQLIRNSATHNPTKLKDPIALEHLAALSYLARLIDKASVVGGTTPGQDESDRPFG